MQTAAKGSQADTRLMRLALERIAAKHVPHAGIDGTGAACAECMHLHPCPTRRLASWQKRH